MPGNEIVLRDFYTDVLVMSFEAKYTKQKHQPKRRDLPADTDPCYFAVLFSQLQMD